MAYDKSVFEKRILFVGMPDTAYVTLHALHKAGVNVVGVVTPPKNHPAYLAFTAYAQNFGYKIISPDRNINEPDIILQVRELNSDLAIVTSYSQKISKDMLDSTKDGFVNVHPSLLPEYRGANPYSHVIINGEYQTGVTIHKMDEDFDTGEILLQNAIQIMSNDTMGTIFNKLNRLSSEVLVQFLMMYEQKGLPVGISQKSLEAPKNKATKILPESEQVAIDWSKSAFYLERFIRGLNPFFPASTNYKGFPVKVYSAEIEPMPKNLKKELGLVCRVGKTIDVITGEGILKIKTLQMGSFFVGDAKDFIARVKIKIGDKFD